MKAKFYAANPNGIPMTLVLTMPLEDWVKVREAIDKSGEPTHVWRARSYRVGHLRHDAAS